MQMKLAQVNNGMPNSYAKLISNLQLVLWNMGLQL